MNVFILSQLCRPTVHGQSCWENEQWVLNEGIHIQMQNSNATSMDCWPTAHGLLANSPWAVGQLQIQSMDCSNAKSMDCGPTVHGLYLESSDCRPTVHELLKTKGGGISAEKPWTVGRQSMDCCQQSMDLVHGLSPWTLR